MDVRAVVVGGFVECTSMPELETPLKELRRWYGMNELMVSTSGLNHGFRECAGVANL